MTSDTVLKAERILAWAKHVRNFNTSMVESIAEQGAMGKELSPKQIAAIDNIYEKCNIEAPRVDLEADIMRCETILQFMSHQSWFDTSFIEKMYDKLERGRPLSDKQSAAVETIYNKFCLSNKRRY